MLISLFKASLSSMNRKVDVDSSKLEVKSDIDFSKDFKSPKNFIPGKTITFKSKKS